MHVFMVVGRDGDAETFIEERIRSLGATRIDFELQKIEQVRELVDLTRLKLSQKTAICIKAFDSATEEAQNALLKSIEEPQENLFFILCAEGTHTVLPTVLSRSSVEYVRSQVSIEEEKSAKDFFERTIGEQLSITSKITNRHEAIKFLQELVYGGSQLLKENPKFSKAIEAAQSTVLKLKSSGNVQIQLTSFVVKINS